MKRISVLSLVLSFLTLCPSLVWSQSSIATVRGGTLGSTYTITGTLTSGSEFGTIRFIEDGTAGIGLYDVSLAGYETGDSITVTGDLVHFNSLLELQPISSVSSHGTGKAIEPQVFADLSTGFSESYEGELLEFKNVKFVSSGTFSASSDNYDITDGTNTREVRINGASAIAGTSIPTGFIDIRGVMGQYCSGCPASGTSGYQLLPRTLADLITPANPPIISSPLWQWSITPTSFTVAFETINPGNTEVEYGTTMALGSTVSDAAFVTNHSINLSGLSPSTLYYVRATSVSPSDDTSISNIVPMMTGSLSTGEVNVYFNNTVDHSASTGTDAVWCNGTFSDTLISYINKAKYTMDVAIYNADDAQGVLTAINDAYNRGVVVRVIADNGMSATNYGIINVGTGNKTKSPTGAAPSGGFYGIQHNKFIAIDANSTDPNDSWVITGSTNWTSGQLSNDPNNMIMIQDQSLAKAYTMEFEEMWGGKFGPEKTDNTPHYFNVGGAAMELWFSPSDDVEDRLIETIETAENDLHLGVFIITRAAIGFAVEDAINAGVYAAGVVEIIDTSHTVHGILTSNMGSKLRLDPAGLFHHKYLIVDEFCDHSDPLVWTGSYNFSGAGDNSNDENSLVIHSADIANQYYQEWIKRYNDDGGSGSATLCTPSSIETRTPLSGVSIHPNPSDGLLWLELEEGAASVAVMNLQGALVHQQLATEKKECIDLSHLSPGLYLMRLRSGGLETTLKVQISR